MKILIATDGSDFSNAAVEECCRIALRPEAEVLIVSAYEDAYPITAEPFAISAEYYQKLDNALSELASTFVDDARQIVEGIFPGVALSTEILRGPPIQKIIERAEEWKADLIVVGSHGRGFGGACLDRFPTVSLTMLRARYLLYAEPEINWSLLDPRQRGLRSRVR